MEQRIAKMAIEFMGRTELKGREVAGWSQVMSVLLQYAEEVPPNKKSKNKSDKSAAIEPPLGSE